MVKVEVEPNDTLQQLAQKLDDLFPGEQVNVVNPTCGIDMVYKSGVWRLNETNRN
jgi:hypothetical protein